MHPDEAQMLIVIAQLCREVSSSQPQEHVAKKGQRMSLRRHFSERK